MKNLCYLRHQRMKSVFKGQGMPCPYMINSVPLRQHKQFIRMAK